VQQTVMFDKLLTPGETSKRFLAADDINAVCTIYPPSLDPHVCAADQANVGCAVAAVPARRARRGWWTLLALGVVAPGLAWRRGRRRRGGPPSVNVGASADVDVTARISASADVSAFDRARS
jgi:hypothetical protein